MSGALAALATFLAAGVEWVEALTIVLAVGMFKSWRTAIVATLSAFATLAVLVALLGFGLSTVVSIGLVRTAVGIGLLLFGVGWLYKAILRSTGLKALHDEAAAFEEAQGELMSHGHAFGTAFGGVFLEGLEVVFIVVALGGLNSRTPAIIGASLSLLVVAAAGIYVRGPLSRVPENTVKYAVGVMLTAFGTFFAGEGLGVVWWHDDLVLVPLIVGYAAASLIFVQYLRRRPHFLIDLTVTRWLQAVVAEVWGLFVTDATLGIFVLTALLFIPVFIDRLKGGQTIAGIVLVIGILIALGVALRNAAQSPVGIANHVAQLSSAVSTSRNAGREAKVLPD